jgi:hypothetical protein
VLPFGSALLAGRSRRHLRQSPDRDGEGEYPHRYSVHGSHLLGRRRGPLQATSPSTTPSNPLPERRSRAIGARRRRMTPELATTSLLHRCRRHAPLHIFDIAQSAHEELSQLTFIELRVARVRADAMQSSRLRKRAVSRVDVEVRRRQTDMPGHNPTKLTVSLMSARAVRSRGTPSFSNPTETPQTSTSPSSAPTIWLTVLRYIVHIT